MKIAFHTDLFINTALVELRMYWLHQWFLNMMAETIMKLMLGSAGAQKDIWCFVNFLANNVLARRDAFLHTSPLRSYYDKLLHTRSIFAQKLLDGFIQPAAEEAHKTGQFTFTKPSKPSPSPKANQANGNHKFTFARWCKDNNNWFRPSRFFWNSKWGRGRGKGSFSMRDGNLGGEPEPFFQQQWPERNWPLDRLHWPMHASWYQPWSLLTITSHYTHIVGRLSLHVREC